MALQQMEEMGRKMREENAELSVEVARLRGREAQLQIQAETSQQLVGRLQGCLERLMQRGATGSGKAEAFKREVGDAME